MCFIHKFLVCINFPFFIIQLQQEPLMDEKFKEELEEKYTNNDQFKDLLKFRKKLPAYDKRDEINSTLQKSKVILITGETGESKFNAMGIFDLSGSTVFLEHKSQEQSNFYIFSINF